MIINTTIRTFCRVAALAAIVAMIPLAVNAQPPEGGGPPGFGPRTAEEEPVTIESRLQKMEDIEAIRLLMDRYVELNESRDYKTYSEMFAKNGVLITRRGRAAGPDNIYQFLEENFGGANTPPGLQNILHVISNVKIEVNKDRASASSRWTMLLPNDDDRPRLGGIGEYHDLFVREDGEWKFKQRVIKTKMPKG